MEPQQTDKTAARKSMPAWLTFGTSVAVLTLLLTLMGYGWTTGYLRTFGLRPSDLQRTPFDFLLASEEVIIRMLSACAKVVRNPPWDLLLDFWSTTWMYAAGCLAVVFVLALLWVHRDGLNRLYLRWIYPNNVFTKVRAGAKRVTSVVTHGLQQRHWFGAAAFTAAYLLAPPLLMFAVYFVLSVFSVGVVAVPLQPALLGEHYAKSKVIDPKGCASLPGETPVREGAPCIRLVKEQCEVARGRRIDATSERVWLLLNTPLRVMSIPLDETSVEDVSSEQPANPCTP